MRREREAIWVVLQFSLPWFCFRSDWRHQRNVWAILRCLPGCMYWSLKNFSRMGGLVGGKSLTMWGVEVWATFVIRSNGGILRDIHTHFQVFLWDSKISECGNPSYCTPTKRSAIYTTGNDEGTPMYRNMWWVPKHRGHWGAERREGNIKPDSYREVRVNGEEIYLTVI